MFNMLTRWSIVSFLQIWIKICTFTAVQYNSNNGMKFTTPDRDNDQNNYINWAHFVGGSMRSE